MRGSSVSVEKSPASTSIRATKRSTGEGERIAASVVVALPESRVAGTSGASPGRRAASSSRAASSPSVWAMRVRMSPTRSLSSASGSGL